MGFQMPEGSEAEGREAVGAEFWKPRAVKDVIIGRVVEFRKNAVGEHIVLEPAIIYAGNEDPEGFASMAVGVNSWLRKRVNTETDCGKVLVIKYLGDRPTPPGPMRTYKVGEIDEVAWQKILKRDCEDLIYQDSESGTEQGSEEEDEDLPF